MSCDARSQVVTFLALTIALCLRSYYFIISPESSDALPDLAASVSPLWRSVLVAATGGFVLEALLALGEELGWRGLLVPELARVPVPYGLVVFGISFMASSFLLAWLRVKSGSIWTAVVFHASHNLFIENVFDRLTVSRELTQYVTTEFGLGLAAVYSVVAYACWRSWRELPTMQRSS